MIVLISVKLGPAHRRVGGHGLLPRVDRDGRAERGAVIYYIYIYICVCVCICIYVCVCIYMCICIYIYICVCKYMYVCMYVYICIYMFICICIHMYIRTHTHTPGSTPSPAVRRRGCSASKHRERERRTQSQSVVSSRRDSCCVLFLLCHLVSVRGLLPSSPQHHMFSTLCRLSGTSSAVPTRTLCVCCLWLDCDRSP